MLIADCGQAARPLHHCADHGPGAHCTGKEGHTLVCMHAIGTARFFPVFTRPRLTPALVLEYSLCSASSPCCPALCPPPTTHPGGFLQLISNPHSLLPNAFLPQQTQVGSSEVRGISGGERKRLTTAEILVGQQPVLFMGECAMQDCVICAFGRSPCCSWVSGGCAQLYAVVCF